MVSPLPIFCIAAALCTTGCTASLSCVSCVGFVFLHFQHLCDAGISFSCKESVSVYAFETIKLKNNKTISEVKVIPAMCTKISARVEGSAQHW
jgi:hypothetical protein